jgi:hypothetical protein
MNIDMTIKCNVCLKNYKTRTTFNRHVCKISDDSIICKFCNKEFKSKYNRKNHEIKCNENHTQTLMEENEKLKMIINELEVAKTEGMNVNNNITNNSTVNNITNNQIIISSFGDEDTSHITKKQLIKAFKMCKEFPLEMIKMIHFNKERPENHNIYKPNFKDKYVKYFNDSVWKIGDAKKIITELYMSKMDIAEEKFDDLKPYLSEITQDRFQWFLDNREEADVMSEILKKIAEMLYNERSVVLHDTNAIVKHIITNDGVSVIK